MNEIVLNIPTVDLLKQLEFVKISYKTSGGRNLTFVEYPVP